MVKELEIPFDLTEDEANSSPVSRRAFLAIAATSVAAAANADHISAVQPPSTDETVMAFIEWPLS